MNEELRPTMSMFATSTDWQKAMIDWQRAHIADLERQLAERQPTELASMIRSLDPAAIVASVPEDYEVMFQHETTELVMRHIDRMNDVCEQDTADRIIESFTRQFQVIFDKYLAVKFPSRGRQLAERNALTKSSVALSAQEQVEPTDALIKDLEFAVALSGKSYPERSEAISRRLVEYRALLSANQGK